MGCRLCNIGSGAVAMIGRVARYANELLRRPDMLRNVGGQWLQSVMEPSQLSYRAEMCSRFDWFARGRE